MESGIQLILTKEQAALLTPILQQILPPKHGGELPNIQPAEYKQLEKHPPQDFASDDPELPNIQPAEDKQKQNDSFSKDAECSDNRRPGNFLVEELLKKKKKNGKSTRAQNFINYSIREATKMSDLWDKAPTLKEISPQSMSKFYSSYFKICPELSNERQAVWSRLSDTMINRRAYLKKLASSKKKTSNTTPISKPPKSQYAALDPSKAPSTSQSSQHKIKPGTSNTTPISKPPKSQYAAPDPSKAPSTSQSSQHKIKPGILLEVMHKNSVIGTALLLAADQDNLFSSVILKSIYKNVPEDIDLYQPVDGVTCFHELQVGDTFEWKSARLMVKGTKMSLTEATSKDKGTESSSEEEEGEILSEYEKQREERIKENKVFDEIFKSGPIQPMLKTLPNEKEPKKMFKKVNKVNKSGFQKRMKQPTGKDNSKKRKNSEINTLEAADRSKKKAKYWEIVDDDDSCLVKDIFKETLVNRKRTPKPKKPI